MFGARLVGVLTRGVVLQRLANFRRILFEVCLILFGASTTEKLDILTGKGNGHESTGMITRVTTELFTK